MPVSHRAPQFSTKQLRSWLFSNVTLELINSEGLYRRKIFELFQKWFNQLSERQSVLVKSLESEAEKQKNEEWNLSN